MPDLNPLSEARDRIHNLMVPSRIRFCCAMTGTPYLGTCLDLELSEDKLKLHYFFFPGLQVQHIEVPRLAVELELQLPAYATAKNRQL